MYYNVGIVLVVKGTKGKQLIPAVLISSALARCGKILYNGLQAYKALSICQGFREQSKQRGVRDGSGDSTKTGAARGQ